MKVLYATGWSNISKITVFFMACSIVLNVGHAYAMETDPIKEIILGNLDNPSNFLEKLMEFTLQINRDDKESLRQHLERCLQSLNVSLSDIEEIKGHQSILHCACEKNNLEAVKFIISIIDDNDLSRLLLMRNNKGYTALHFAASMWIEFDTHDIDAPPEEKSIVVVLIDAAKRCDILEKFMSIKDADRRTALDIAEEYGDSLNTTTLQSALAFARENDDSLNTNLHAVQTTSLQSSSEKKRLFRKLSSRSRLFYKKK